MKGEQQHNLGIWETDGRVVTALVDLRRLTPQPAVEKTENQLNVSSRILKTRRSRWHKWCSGKLRVVPEQLDRSTFLFTLGKMLDASICLEISPWVLIYTIIDTQHFNDSVPNIFTSLCIFEWHHTAVHNRCDLSSLIFSSKETETFSFNSIESL